MGSYSFEAVYSGDTNYAGSTSTCEPFTVTKGTSQTATTVFDAATNAAWAGTETAGAHAYDTATVTPSDGFTPTGTITYTVFTDSICTGTGSPAGTVTLNEDGTVPNSAIQGPLVVGSYAFRAVYSGDANYAGSISACEPFTVNQGTSQTATTVFDATTNAAWAGTETTGAHAYDTATVTASAGFTATGTITYTVFPNSACTGAGSPAGGGALAAGLPPNSTTQGPLAAGSYSFEAVYSGDTNYAGSTSTCEPFTVNQGTSDTATTVFDATTNAAWAGTETTGAHVYDTATVTPSAGFTPTGTVTYTFFTNGGCTGTGSPAGTLTLNADGAVPNSDTQGPLAAGSYSFAAVYSGDTNYAPSTSTCEPFKVATGTSDTDTTVFDAATNGPWNGNEATNAMAYDTATVTTSDGVTATGTVTYTFFTNGGCTGTGSPAGTVTLNADGTVPNSDTQGPLAAGSYSFQAVYSGDTNYGGSVSTCEPFSLGRLATNTATTVFDATANTAWAGTETAGDHAYDTATVTGVARGITPTGTVSYTFFTNGGCSGTGGPAGTVTLNGDGAVPNSDTQGPLAAGAYSFQAVYSGDTDYGGSVSACEPFTVNQGSSETATTVFNATTNTAWAGTETAGAKAYDTAAVTPSAGFTATGAITYTFFTNSGCTGTGSPAGTVTLNGNGTVPNSDTQGPLAAGAYSFEALYSGDTNYAGSTSACEPFTVTKGTSQTATTVFDAATTAAWAGTETTGAHAYDTAAVTPSAGAPTATGAITYTFFTNSGCTGTGSPAGTVTLNGDGTVPNSDTQGPLAAGSYSFEALYSGDTNYGGSVSACEPFTVNQGTSQTATTVFDAATNAAWAGTETTGAHAYDTATVTASAGFTATGTITYTVFPNSACSGAGSPAGGGALAAGVPPNSTTQGPLAAGSYSFEAVYSGDTNYAGSTSTCEPFTINQGTSDTATTVFDATTNAAWAGTETTGAHAYDTATVTPSAGAPAATGTVTYTFFTNGACSGSGSPAGGGALAAGLPPNSSTQGPLAAGSYSFQAVYSGDTNYAGSTSACEPFTVKQGSSETATTVFDAATNAAWAGTETTGANAYDTATVTPSAGFTATGTITYTFFPNSGCSGTGSPAGTVTLNGDGTVPNSAIQGPLAAGSYGFQAVYSGDTNYAGSTSACEPFTVNQGSSETATTVFDAATNTAWAGTETTGANAYDTATVTPSAGFTATGTITYTFFTNSGCSGTGSPAGTVTLNGDGSVPNSDTQGPLAAGSYGFQAVYSGDTNYAPSTSTCEPFQVGTGTSSTATTVFDAATNAAWAGTETTGAHVYDTATVTPSAGAPTATGTITYTVFPNSACSGTGSPAGTVTLDGDGTVPNSETQGPLAAGSYSFEAVYSGDTNYAASTGTCEPFTVTKGTSQTATTVFDAATNAAWAGTETTGANAYDTATVTPSAAFTATGTITYTVFPNSACSGAGSPAGGGALAAGLPPNSTTQGPLAAGSYSFQAVYSGDTDYAGSTSTCEAFRVGTGTSNTATTVFDAATNAAWAGTETTGANAYDTATVTPSAGAPAATGTVAYTFFTNGACSGSGSPAGGGALAAGLPPNSSTQGPLAAGSYSFQAVYSGDTNYDGSTSACEPFTVKQGSSETATTVFDAATNAAWAGTGTTGAKAYDTATVSGAAGVRPTGTVTYTFFPNDACTAGSGSPAGTVTLDGDGTVPNSAIQGPLGDGSYSFQAVYSGDNNYAGSISECEPFSVAKGTAQSTTKVFDPASSAPWTNTETTGTSAYDTATVTGVPGFIPTGTVTYSLFTSDSCDSVDAITSLNGNTWPQKVTLAATGAVPNSQPTGPLTAGSYSFRAVYSGDAHYDPTDSACEPFSVAKGTSLSASTVIDASTNKALTGAEMAGTTAVDTATVTGRQGVMPTGTVTYTFFANDGCTGSGKAAGTVTLTAAGAVPPSTTQGPLAAGSYSFQASYSGDGNYHASTGACEPFTIDPNPPPAPVAPITNVTVPVTG